MRTLLLAFLSCYLGLNSLRAADTTYDVVVIGGTPGGIAAAVTAARLGRNVALLDENARVGGMATSGLGKSDIENRPAIQGLFREFVDRIKNYYVTKYGADSEQVKLCRDGYYYEPSVAEKIFHEMLGGEGNRIRVFPSHAFVRAETADGRIVAVQVEDRATKKTETFRGKTFIDATYEGDVYASAGARFRLGRESREETGEPHAGEIYFDWRKKEFLGGSGKGDDRLQTYSYRLCFSTDPKNQAPMTSPPPDYDRTRYLGYLEELTSGRMGKSPRLIGVAFTIAGLPNNKTDTNMNPRSLGFVFVEENKGYITADRAERDRIRLHIRNLALGLLWFLQNDEAVPEAQREEARRFHLARDEFPDTGNFPFQLYVREGRRLNGLYTLAEQDITKQKEGKPPVTHADAIAVGEFPIDSFPYRKRQPGDDKVLEGYVCMLADITARYQIPYRIMVPEKLDGLLAPVAASTTHVAYASIRMEPTWIALGQAAGVAAHVALEDGVQPRAVNMKKVQDILRKQGAVLEFTEPAEVKDPKPAKPPAKKAEAPPR